MWELHILMPQLKREQSLVRGFGKKIAERHRGRSNGFFLTHS
jgi:hypothetical protein